MHIPHITQPRTQAPHRRARLASALVASTLLSFSQAGLADTFSLSSPDLDPAQPMPMSFVFNGFGCTGENLSPALRWDHPPAGTRSFAITVYDPDAPTGSGWWHWVVYNLPAETRGVARHASGAQQLPKGAVEGRTDYGQPGYGGPCPPTGHGDHRYQFRVHALDTDRLELPADASAALVGYMLNQHRLGVAELDIRYGR